MEFEMFHDCSAIVLYSPNREKLEQRGVDNGDKRDHRHSVNKIFPKWRRFKKRTTVIATVSNEEPF